MAEKRNAVVLRGLKKYFPGTKALDWGADDAIEIKEGEIHGQMCIRDSSKITKLMSFLSIFLQVHTMQQDSTWMQHVKQDAALSTEFRN